MQHDFILLDRSSSMHSLWGEALSSINLYVKKLAEDKVDTGVTLAVFDTNHTGYLDFQIIRERIIPSTWKDVSNFEVQPRGSTPLNDATGKIINLAEAGGYEKLALIIMTDGEENASREYTTNAIKAKLDAFRAKGYQVIFLGANFDNQRQAANYGNAPGQTISSSAMNLVGTMEQTSILRNAYSTTGAAMAYTTEMKTAAASDTKVDFPSANNVALASGAPKKTPSKKA